MLRRRGFALFDVLLAVVLMMIAAGASYTLVKSFRANSSVQQLIRYSTNISQSFMPFIDGSDYSNVLSSTTHQLSSDFLDSIGIPGEDQVTSAGEKCGGTSCYVDSGMYLINGSVSRPMSFAVSTSDAGVSYFIIAVQASSAEVNQMLQSASSLFSIYCPQGARIPLSGQSSCSLIADTTANSAMTYSLFLVFPKSGDKAPSSTGIAPVSG